MVVDHVLDTLSLKDHLNVREPVLVGVKHTEVRYVVVDHVLDTLSLKNHLNVR